MRACATSKRANCFHPGSVQTRFGALGLDMGLLLNVVSALAKPSTPPEQGADSLIALATAPEAASLKGLYVSNRRPVSPSTQAMAPTLAADLRTLSEKTLRRGCGSRSMRRLLKAHCGAKLIV
jgi:hypothetical protein